MEKIKSKSILTQAVQEYSDFENSIDIIETSNYEKCYMYILVNKSLNLTPGKVASQVGHAVQKLIKSMKNQKYKSFLANGSPKIILSVPSEEKFIEILDQTKKYEKVYIIDEGLTQCSKNSVTVVGYDVINENNIPLVFKSLSLFNK